MPKAVIPPNTEVKVGGYTVSHNGNESIVFSYGEDSATVPGPAPCEEILIWFAEHELQEDLWWSHRSGQIKFYILCNDMFWWATADLEEILPEDLPQLTQAYQDLEALGGCQEVWAPQLWISRKRQMRPQRPWWDRERLPEGAKGLFLAAGPPRDPKEEG